MRNILCRWYEVDMEKKMKMLAAAAVLTMMFFTVMPLMGGYVCDEELTGKIELKVYSLLECYPLGLMVVTAPLLNIFIMLQSWEPVRKRKWYIRTAVVFFLCFGICTLKMWNWLQGNVEGGAYLCKTGMIYPLFYVLSTAGIMNVLK